MLHNIIEIIIGLLVYDKLPGLISATGLLASLIKLVGVLLCADGVLRFFGIYLL